MSIKIAHFQSSYQNYQSPLLPRKEFIVLDNYLLQQEIITIKKNHESRDDGDETCSTSSQSNPPLEPKKRMRDCDEDE